VCAGRSLDTFSTGGTKNMNRRFRFLATVVSLGLLATLTPSLAYADARLIYTGLPFNDRQDNLDDGGTYTLSMFVSIQIDLVNALGANFDGEVNQNRFFIKDGRTTLQSAPGNGVVESFTIVTDSLGDISSWRIQVGYSDVNTGLRYFISSVGDGTTAQDFGNIGLTTNSVTRVDFGAQTHNAGQWSTQTIPSAVPEPATLSLLVIGLAGLGFQLRKRM